MAKKKKAISAQSFRTFALLCIGGAWALALWRYDVLIAIGALLIIVAGALMLGRLETVRGLSPAQRVGLQAVFWVAVVALPLAYLLENAIGPLGPVALLIGVATAAFLWWKVNIRDQEVCQSLRSKGLSLVAKGDWNGAEPVLKKALNQAMQLKANRNETLGTAFQDLSSLYVKMNRWAEAQEYCLRAITTMEDPGNTSHPHLPAALETLARINARQRNFNSFESILDKSYSLLAARLGEKTPEAVAKLFEYARLCDEEDRPATSARYYEMCAARIKNAIGEKSEPLALCHHFAGQAAARAGDGNLATENFTKAIATFGNIYGPADPKVAPPIEALAETLLAQRSVRPSLEAFSRALAIREDEYGANHRLVGRLLSRIAECHAVLNEFALAEKNAVRAASILERTADKQLHSATGILARVKVSLGDMETADSLYALAIAQARKSSSGQHHLPGYLESKAAVAARLGHADEVEAIQAQLEEMRETQPVAA